MEDFRKDFYSNEVFYPNLKLRGLQKNVIVIGSKRRYFFRRAGGYAGNIYFKSLQKVLNLKNFQT